MMSYATKYHAMHDGKGVLSSFGIVLTTKGHDVSDTGWERSPKFDGLTNHTEGMLQQSFG